MVLGPKNFAGNHFGSFVLVPIRVKTFIFHSNYNFGNFLTLFSLRNGVDPAPFLHLDKTKVMHTNKRKKKKVVNVNIWSTLSSIVRGYFTRSEPDLNF